jgi:hypothetical protein
MPLYSVEALMARERFHVRSRHQFSETIIPIRSTGCTQHLITVVNALAQYARLIFCMSLTYHIDNCKQKHRNSLCIIF